MHVYNVSANTKCLLIVQDPTKDIETKDYITKLNSSFLDKHLTMDYVRYVNMGHRLKQKGLMVNEQYVDSCSLAIKLASKGYYIFCRYNANDKYLLAVHNSNVEVL